MLSIGAFSKICKVSTKTLRYYAEIGLILPGEINPENGYRYYAIEQLETMLLIIRLKSYNFSLEEIKQIIEPGELYEEKLYVALTNKREEIKRLLHEQEKRLQQLQPGQILPGLRGAGAPEERGRAPAEKIPPVYAFRAVKVHGNQGFFRMVGRRWIKLSCSPQNGVLNSKGR